MDILGSTTPSSILASVASGVGSTGNDIWPLLILAGVPLAFVIYRYVVGAVKHTMGSDTRTGYYQSKDGGKLEYMEDQKLGEMEHAVQTKGMWP